MDSSEQGEVEESITNLCGFERAMGRSQHVTLGSEFLSKGVTFSANCDKGLTRPDPELPPSSQWATGTEFTYPDVPRKDGAHFPAFILKSPSIYVRKRSFIQQNASN